MEKYIIFDYHLGRLFHYLIIQICILGLSAPIKASVTEAPVSAVASQAMKELPASARFAQMTATAGEPAGPNAS